MSDVEKSLRKYVIGESEGARNLRVQILRVANSDVPVLIGGPTGAGKEFAARGIHSLSARAGQSVAINCGAIPENLVEAELFGYERGAFSGAERRHIGHIERANGGTLFLDEIGDLPLAVQVKLLRVLETQCFFRVGGKEEINVDLRLVAASHKDLDQAVGDGRFREDLLYRINTILIDVPPLCERGGDVKEYFSLFIENYRERSGRLIDIEFEEDFWDGLEKYNWPGNIRELKNIAERAMVFFEGQTVSKKDLFSTLISGNKSGLVEETKVSGENERGLGFEDLLGFEEFGAEEPGAHLGTDQVGLFVEQLFENTAKNNVFEFDTIMGDIETATLDYALRLANGNVSKAAKMLNLRRTTLASKLAKRKK